MSDGKKIIIDEDWKSQVEREKEQAAYDDRCRQIGREVLYLFSRV